MDNHAQQTQILQKYEWTAYRGLYGVENGNAEQFCDSWHGGDSAKSPVWAKIISAYDGSKLNHLFLLHPIRKMPVYMYIYSTYVCVCVWKQPRRSTCHLHMLGDTIEEGFVQKKRQTSSLLFGGQIVFHSLLR